MLILEPKDHCQIYCYYYSGNNDSLKRMSQFYKKFEDISDKIIIIFNEKIHNVICDNGSLKISDKIYIND